METGPTQPVRVLFIAGLGRSGSTLIDRALGSARGCASLGEVVRYLLAFLQDVGEHGEDPARQGDVPGLHRYARRAGKSTDDGKEGEGRQGRGFVRPGIDDGW